MQLLSTRLSSAGIPPHVDHSQLELAVVYNMCVCFTAQSQFSEAELLLKEATERGRPLCEKMAIYDTIQELMPQIQVFVSSEILKCEFYSLPFFFTVLQVTGNNADTSDPLVLWRAGLKSAGNTALHPHVLYLLCLQWALWLAKCQLENIGELQVR